MADRAQTPPSQTPSAGSTITPIPATPGSRRPFRPRTPGGPISSPIPPRMSSPFPPRTPGGATTPGGTITACSLNASDFATVKVHTAKCSECDKRNMDTMRRCPGCTFQVCKPCYDRRQREGRNLAHGNMQGPATPMTGGGASIVKRRKPASVVVTPGVVGTPGRMGASRREVQENDETVVSEEGDKPASIPKKRAAKPKKKDSSSDESSGDEFVLEGDSPTPGKRRRTLGSTPTATSIRPSRKQPDNSAPLQYIRSPPTSAPTDTAFSTSFGTRPSTLDHDILMQAVGVNTPENPYQQHLLSRQNPVISNPVIAIPDIVKRGFKPRPRATEALKTIHEQAVAKSEAAHHVAPSSPPSQTIRSLLASEVVRYYQDTPLDDDEKDELLSTVKEAARKWAVRLYNSLPATALKHVTRGLDMRLEHIEEAQRIELDVLIGDVAAGKMTELLGDNWATCSGPSILTKTNSASS
ncbi:hypothetical protein P153DRAFT_435636 [Dothidotthia symphoricarpi CBS 119687]|uniref:Uncharacterized protein n=1 Tax=Dothidotthia symphoricarpi CBS 119687 TaxID=1392245 RepID=A0A6A5ZWS5_9PLEO|nr:uncharacterized protein P153DRAFT_435636 [Dothidotthia symphoricarpi CBS 119687]KAF2124030.1 hypothetical protein P153DRAFT_435636 [Dothidotthia symphoricarpi CBS 119687]